MKILANSNEYYIHATFMKSPKTILSNFKYSMLLWWYIKSNIIKIKGCFFHYIKCLWSKAKKIGIVRKKKTLENTKIIIFLLKIIILIKSEFM